MLYFTADSHFSDSKILTRERRDFEDVGLMNMYIIDTWNKQVLSDEDPHIYHLGDFISYNATNTDTWFNLHLVQEIKAPVTLIIGNNERRLIKKEFNGNFDAFRLFCKTSCGFQDVLTEAFINIGELPVHLCHYPHKCVLNMVNLFGHLHSGGGIYRPYGFNIGLDTNHYRMFSEDDIMRLYSDARNFWDSCEEMQIWTERDLKKFHLEKGRLNSGDFTYNSNNFEPG